MKTYEFTNHLGNVLETITDYKLPVPQSGHDSLVDHYTANIVTGQDYYPGGMLMQGRQVQNNYQNYRYGFNGKENDDEAKGQSNQIDYGARVYDPRVVRFLSTDPLTNKYPYYSPYQFSGNTPIKFIDLYGKEPAQPDQLDYKGKTWAVDKPYQLTGGDTKYGSSPSTITLGNYSIIVDNSKFLTNPVNENKYKTYVNTTSQFLLNGETAFKNEHDLVNHLLGDFIWGKGSENIVFPHNGTFSSALKGSTAVGAALLDWARNNFVQKKPYLWEDRIGGEIEMTSKGGLTSLEHFLGSVSVKISKTDANRINVEIFNVTSMHSGYLTKSLPIVNWFVTALVSTVRNSGDHQLTYSNVSQYFSFDISTGEAEKLINSQLGENGQYKIK
jgi:RHS repeat-associated protein